MSLAISTHVQALTNWEFVAQQAKRSIEKTIVEENKELDQFRAFPIELFLYIFRFLTPANLCQASCVCKKWRMLASDQSLWNAFDLKKLFPSLKVIDEVVWENYVDLSALGLEITDIHPIGMRSTILTLKSFTSLDIEDDLGVTLLTLPKGLTFDKLRTFAQLPKNGNSTLLWSGFSEELKNLSIKETQRIVITNSILKNSRNLSTLELEKLVNEKGAELPDALSVLTLAVVTYVSSSQNPPTRLYRDRPRTYTVCFGNLEDKKVCKLIAGGFTALKGISVHYNCCKAAYKGAGAMRKL